MVKDELADALRAALEAIGVEAPEQIPLERPARAEHGDWSSTIALVVGKKAGRVPRELAQALVTEIEKDPPPAVESVSIAGPGFINFELADTWLHDVLGTVVAQGTDDYARLDHGKGRSINVEFVSANPTGPLHAGHGRGAAYGDSLARLFERNGFTVSRECYLNDRGVQMEQFAASLLARKRGEDPPDDGYQGAYVSEWATEMPDGADPLEWGRQRAMDDQRTTLERMHVVFDTWFSERSMIESGAIEATLADLRQREVVYEDDGAVWLRSSAFGDDKDRVLIKSDGELTYLTPDIAYHRDKFARGFDELVDVLGADHHGYVPRMRAALEALGHDPDDLKVPIVQMVDTVRDGEPVKLSKRAGDLVALSDVLDVAGPDATRLTYLLQSIDARQTFDLDVVLAASNDNPVFYVQYAHARIHSMGRMAAERGIERLPLDQVDLSALVHERELDLLRVLYELPDVVRLACADRSPHKVATWVRQLAGAFHGFYHDCPVLRDDVDANLAQARLWLVEASRIGLAIGLDLLGVSAPEKM